MLVLPTPPATTHIPTKPPQPHPTPPPTPKRGHLGEVELAAPLLALAAQGDAAVAAQAVGTLANMAVDFSAVKEQLLRREGRGKRRGVRCCQGGAQGIEF